jgi:uncharacterized membrane protein YecN with MAPEG domain
MKDAYIRAQGNFAETVPFIYLLITLAELNGLPSPWVNRAFGSLLALRIAHVELGLKRADSVGVGRPLGVIGSLVSFLYQFKRVRELNDLPQAIGVSIAVWGLTVTV